MSNRQLRKPKGSFRLSPAAWPDHPDSPGNQGVVARTVPPFWAHVEPAKKGKNRLYRTCARLAIKARLALGVSDPNNLLPGLQAWCTATHQNYDDVFVTFVPTYHEIGDTRLWNATVAEEMVRCNPWRVQAPAGTPNRFSTLATYMYYLSLRQDTGEFFLSARKAGSIIGRTHDTGWRYLATAVTLGLVSIVERGTSGISDTRKATVYRWTGPVRLLQESDTCKIQKSDTLPRSHDPLTTTTTMQACREGGGHV